MMHISLGRHAGRHAVATQPHRKSAPRHRAARAIPATTQRQRLIRVAAEILRNIGVALTAAVTALAAVALLHAVSVEQPLFASSTVRPATTDDFSSHWVERVAAKVLPSVVTLQVGDDGGSVVGSGVILDASGLIITNNHVVAAAEQFPHGSPHTAVTLNDGRTTQFDVVAADPRSDVAVVRARHLSGLKPISPASSASLRVGQPVVAVGSPLGLDGTVTEGIISALNRPVCPRVRVDHGVLAYEAIQTDAPINPGNSGGALVDFNGRLIGSINSAGATLGSAETSAATPEGSIGLGFAIPVQTALRIATQLIATGRASHGWLGAEVSSDVATRGARIVDVTAGSPAAAVGLTPGALVTEFGDHVVAGGYALVAAVQSAAPGSSVSLAFTDTAGNRRTVHVILGTDQGRD